MNVTCAKFQKKFDIRTVADGDSQEFQEVSRPVSWHKDYLTGS